MADEAGVSQIVLSEHVALSRVITGHPGVRPGTVTNTSFFPSEEEYPEPMVALAAVAASTSRVRLSTNVLLATMRPPVLLAKMVATLDVLSGGRVDLGVGTGWLKEEFEALGVPIDRLGRRLDECIDACRVLWAGGPSSFRGSTVSFDEMYCSPVPVQRRVPVWFGGGPTPITAERVVRRGDGWSPLGNATPEDVAEGVALIAEAGKVHGRDLGEISVRCSLPVARDANDRPTVTETLAQAQPFVDAGATVIQLPSLRHFGDLGTVNAALEEAVETVSGLRKVKP
jgi:probable F420-dependent oxidoreductase